MERDLPGAPAQFHRARPGAPQAAVLQPAMSLGARDLEDVLDLARQNGKALDAVERLRNDRARAPERLVVLGWHTQRESPRSDCERPPDRGRQSSAYFQEQSLSPDRRSQGGRIRQWPRRDQLF